MPRSSCHFEKTKDATKAKTLGTYHGACFVLMEVGAVFNVAPHYGGRDRDTDRRLPRSSFGAQHKVTSAGPFAREGYETRLLTVRAANDNNRLRSAPLRLEARAGCDRP